MDFNEFFDDLMDMTKSPMFYKSKPNVDSYSMDIPEGYEIDHDSLLKGKIILKKKHKDLPKSYNALNITEMPKTISDAGNAYKKLIMMRDAYNATEKEALKIARYAVIPESTTESRWTVSLCRMPALCPFRFYTEELANEFLTNCKDLLDIYHKSIKLSY